MITYKSNSKEVSEKVRKHVKEFYSDMALLKANAEAAGGAHNLVSGGDFLIYYYDQRKFLDGLHLNNKNNKEFSDDQVWTMYKLLVTRAIEQLVK